MSTPVDPGERPPSDGRAHSREVLDGAVRRLALGAGPIRGRVQMASAVLLRGLARDDLADGEDQELFERIQLALMELERLGDRDPGAEPAPDPAVQAIAAQIVELRDTVTERAIEAHSDAIRPGPLSSAAARTAAPHPAHRPD